MRSDLIPKIGEEYPQVLLHRNRHRIAFLYSRYSLAHALARLLTRRNMLLRERPEAKCKGTFDAHPP